MIGFIEPGIEQRTIMPIEDEITSLVEMALKESAKGCYYSMEKFIEGSGWKGWHVNCDGQKSSNKDYKLKNGMVTNSLIVHYFKWFRPAIDADEYSRLWALADYYGKLPEIKALTPEEYREECESNLKLYLDNADRIGLKFPAKTIT